MSQHECGEMVIEPLRGRKEKELPAVGCLFANPQDAAVAREQLLRDGGTKRFLFNSSLTVSQDGGFFVAGPTVGSPMAVMALEKLIVLGARRIILFGWCGTLVPDMAIGDCLLAGKGLSGEGTSSYYSSESEPEPSPVLCALLRRALERAHLTCHAGRLWSTDAPYREGRLRLRNLQEEHGIVAVDMEYTALCSVATFRGVELAGLFVVSDEVWQKEWTPGFTRPEFRARLHQTITQLLELMAAGDLSEENLGGQGNA